jgi:hypothetical protein
MSREHLEKAKMLLDKTGSTCVLCGDDVIITDKRRGVKPLLDLLDGNGNTSGFSAADKVVGKAAAFLYCLLEIKDLFAKVISQPALDVLRSAGISVEYEELVPAIKNRAGDGYCPMETAVWNISDPDNALIAIRDTLFHLSK